MTREDMLKQEEEAWAALLAQFARLSEEQSQMPGPVPGWSAKDLVRHCSVWVREVTPAFEAAASGPWVDPFEGVDEETFEEMNDRFARESKAMAWADVETEAATWRPRLRNALLAMAAEDPAADSFFAEETSAHYTEHTEQIAAFADGLERPPA